MREATKEKGVCRHVCLTAGATPPSELFSAKVAFSVIHTSMAASRVVSTRRLCSRYKYFFYVILVLQAFLAYSFYSMKEEDQSADRATDSKGPHDRPALKQEPKDTVGLVRNLCDDQMLQHVYLSVWSSSS